MINIEAFILSHGTLSITLMCNTGAYGASYDLSERFVLKTVLFDNKI